MKLRILTATLLILTSCYSNLSAQSTQGKSSEDLFPPIDIKSWDKTPVINGRLPTEAETTNGTSLLYYENPTPDVKAYKITLPKLAYITRPGTKKEELVVVIQIVQTAKDTMVGYRPLTGGNGASIFRDFRFLTDNEIKAIVGQ